MKNELNFKRLIFSAASLYLYSSKKGKRGEKQTYPENYCFFHRYLRTARLPLLLHHIQIAAGAIYEYERTVRRWTIPSWPRFRKL